MKVKGISSIHLLFFLPMGFFFIVKDLFSAKIVFGLFANFSFTLKALTSADNSMTMRINAMKKKIFISVCVFYLIIIK